MVFVFLCLAFFAVVSGQYVNPPGAPCGCQQSYPVNLCNCGPPPCPLPPIYFSRTSPTVEKPPISLPAPCIPPPRVISNVCTCQKTFIKPQVYQKTITVPSVQNIVSTGYNPVTETINYQGCPQCCAGSLPYMQGCASPPAPLPPPPSATAYPCQQYSSPAPPRPCVAPYPYQQYPPPVPSPSCASSYPYAQCSAPLPPPSCAPSYPTRCFPYPPPPCASPLPSPSSAPLPPPTCGAYAPAYPYSENLSPYQYRGYSNY